MIRQLSIQDVDRVKIITEACGEDMSSNGVNVWNKDYPSFDVINRDAENGSLYGYELNDEIVGTVMLSTKRDKFYSDIDWSTKDAKHIYVHRLAVHPQFQRQGIARQLMDFGENLARDKGCTSVRLATLSLLERNNKFYKNRGYIFCGDIYLDNKSNGLAHSGYRNCFELVL